MTSQQDKTPEQVLDDFALNYTTEYTSIESKLERGVIDIKQAHSRKEIAYQEALAEAIQALTSWKDKEVTVAVEAERPVKIMGKTIEEVCVILSALELERIADMKMTMSNLNEWMERVRAEHHKAMQKAINKSFESLQSQGGKNE